MHRAQPACVAVAAAEGRHKLAQWNLAGFMGHVVRGEFIQLAPIHKGVSGNVHRKLGECLQDVVIARPRTATLSVIWTA